jgi:hypothetical protein
MSSKDHNIEYIKLKERYKTLSELDASASSEHKMHIKINKLLKETLRQILNYDFKK